MFNVKPLSKLSHMCISVK